MPCILQHSSFNGEIFDKECPPAQDVVGVVRHKSFSYYRLPQKLLKLSVVKLDGSRFDVQVARTASVAELKRRVEDVFDQAPEEGKGKISWSHVWGYFCLCYEGFKLINDKELLRNFGINDGAQPRGLKIILQLMGNARHHDNQNKKMMTLVMMKINIKK
ncbi:U11/U12 small nuclear ribonucleoprotein [Nymphaea thermarum]|nr:U11/U12 small nuclear ribonucleoprotein [Nymphaea thermarum]